LINIPCSQDGPSAPRSIDLSLLVVPLCFDWASCLSQAASEDGTLHTLFDWCLDHLLADSPPGKAYAIAKACCCCAIRLLLHGCQHPASSAALLEGHSGSSYIGIGWKQCQLSYKHTWPSSSSARYVVSVSLTAHLVGMEKNLASCVL